MEMYVTIVIRDVEEDAAFESIAQDMVETIAEKYCFNTVDLADWELP